MTKQDVIDIIKDTQYCILGTIEGGCPKIRPMSPYLTTDGELLVALLPGVRTIKQIKENPMVELCYVDRRMNFCRLSGKAKIVDSLDKKTILWDNIPSMKMYFAGPQDPNFTLMVVSINHVEAMSPHDMQPETIKF
ncbi:MAG: pyridoxamine 5'-phosphate oxidase family protein [Candidatus Omnitrophica bacterium]|nr:pyridoxamine 5'-phosphate oxidase family protein [Candidatus Omnitrophota bacterium]